MTVKLIEDFHILRYPRFVLNLLMNYLKLFALHDFEVKFLIVSKFYEVWKILFLRHRIVLIKNYGPRAYVQNTILEKLRTLNRLIRQNGALMQEGRDA